MVRVSKAAQQEKRDDVFAEVLVATGSPTKAMVAAEPGLANNRDYAKVKAQRTLKRSDIQGKIQKKLENMQASALKNIKNTLTSDNEILANQNAWKIVEQLRGKPVARNLNMNAKVTIEDALFD